MEADCILNDGGKLLTKGSCEAGGTMEERLRQLTRQLLERNDETLRIYEMQREFSFYEDIKPFVDKTDTLLTEWQEAALKWLREARPKYIHASQVDQTYENMRNNALECFGTLKGKRFKQTHQAIRYVLTSILEGDAESRTI